MRGKVLEINQNKKYAGRTNIKWILLEIHDSPSQWNKNGITWKEEYIRKNIDSVRNMPIAVEFLNELEKDEPYGHGLTNIVDGEPLFEDSVVVGVAEQGYIDVVEVNNKKIKALIAEGYIYNQRYPEFVKWLRSQMSEGNMPETSVEICASDGNKTIIYEDGYKEKGRIPMIFDFSGSAILGIPPADNNALVIELNQEKGDKKMADSKEIIELSQKLEKKNTEINELKDSLSKKEEELDKVTSELNEKIEEVDGLVKELKELKEENKKLLTELNELREYKKSVENERLETELNSKLESYTEEEIKIAEKGIEDFKKNPSQEKLNKIISEINSAIAQKILEERKKSKVVENNNEDKPEDIFGDVVETNSNEEASSIEELL